VTRLLSQPSAPKLATSERAGTQQPALSAERGKMTFDQALELVMRQEFHPIDLNDGTRAVVPICSNPLCGIPIRDLEKGIWASLEEFNTSRFALRSFCRSTTCDIFRALRDDNLSSAWWSMHQLWQRDQRSPVELVGEK